MRDFHIVQKNGFHSCLCVMKANRTDYHLFQSVSVYCTLKISLQIKCMDNGNIVSGPELVYISEILQTIFTHTANHCRALN